MDELASPSRREGFGLKFAETMVATCAVIVADHPEPAADEVIGDIEFQTSLTVAIISNMFARALDGDWPQTTR